MALLPLCMLLMFDVIKSDNLNFAKFYKTQVVEDIRPFPPANSFSVKSRLECSTICSRNHNCRKYLYCEANGNKICDTFLDGEGCVSGPNQGQCSCYRKGKQQDGVRCYSPIGYYGSECQYIINDCYEGKLKGMPDVSLSYIRPNGSQHPFEVFCDHGFTTIQRQSKLYEPVNFNRSWADYVEGFGRMHKGHWIGMDKITKILNNYPDYRLTFVLIDTTGFACYISFDDFGIQQENDYRFMGRRATVDPQCYLPYTNNIDEWFSFSTYDHGFSKNCAFLTGGGWWFNNQSTICSSINLNGNLNHLHVTNYPNRVITDSAIRLERKVLP